MTPARERLGTRVAGPPSGIPLRSATHWLDPGQPAVLLELSGPLAGAHANAAAGPRRAGPAISLAAHAAALVLVLVAASIRLPVPPIEPPTVELVIGTGADVAGASAPAAAVTSSRGPSAVSQPAPPVARVPPPPAVQAPVVPPPVVPPDAPGDIQASVPPQSSPAPQQVPQAPTSPQSAQSAPAPPPSATFAPASAAPMDIRLGTGIAAPIAQIEDTGLVHPAESDFGNLPPEYPPEAARRREQGTVILGVRVGPDGSVREVRVLVSSGFRALDKAARERIATWHFRPATRNGEAVGDIVTIPINFDPQ